MRRISGPTVAQDLFGAGKHGYKNGNKALGIQPTDLNAEIFNANQEEMCNFIEAAGLVLDPNDNAQFLKAFLIHLSNADIAVRFATTAAIVLNGLAVQAGGDWIAPLNANDFILVKNQAAAATNGWYKAKAGAWERIEFLNESFEIRPGALTKVTEGATLADSLFMLSTDAPIDLGTTALNFKNMEKAAIPLMHVRDEKTSGAGGGTFTSGAYRTRILNTVKINQIPGASLASNQITLPAGTYEVEAIATAFTVGRHKAKIQNITDASEIAIGTNAFTSSTTSAISNSFVNARFTISDTKVIELQHRCESTVNTIGFGDAVSFGDVEVYAEMKIRKVA